MTVSPSVVNIDTVSFQFRHYPTYVSKSRLASTWLQVNRCDTLKISHVYHCYENGERYEVRRNKVNAFPEYCVPGNSYEVFFEVYYPKAHRFVICSEENDSVVFNVVGTGQQKMEIKPLNELSPVVMHGHLAQTDVVITNNSGQYQVLDSISIPARKWKCYDQFPVVLAPGRTCTLKVQTTYSDHPGGAAHDFVGVFYHTRGSGLCDVLSCYVRATFTHGVVITDTRIKDFGVVRNGDTLRAKLHLLNEGSSVVALEPHEEYGTYAVSKSSIRQGDTATVWLRWVVKYAEGNFLFNQPLFYDSRNGKCTFTFKGTTDKKDKLPHHYVNVDSLIWIETDSYNFGELNQSQGRAERAFKCKNNSPVPIIITNCVTGDGGSMSWSTREPILPGQEFTIHFVQDLKCRIGPFNRAISVTIMMDGKTYQKYIRCSGVVKQNSQPD
jgi:Protein of unknown function (DUF1573)